MQDTHTNPHPGEKTCSVCNMRFKTDGELQEHQRTAHSQHKSNQPASEKIGDQSQKGQKNERVA